jgi:hypothetical protein
MKRKRPVPGQLHDPETQCYYVLATRAGDGPCKVGAGVILVGPAREEGA